MVETTTIEVKVETYRELSGRKNPGDSFDDVIRRLLAGEEPSVYEPARERPQRRREADAGEGDQEDETIRCEHCGHVWTTQSGAERPTCSSCSRKTDRLDPAG